MGELVFGITVVATGAIFLVALTLRDEFVWHRSVQRARMRIDAMLGEVETLMAERRYDESLALAKKALAIAEGRRPPEKLHSIRGWYLVAAVHLHRGDWRKALASFERVRAVIGKDAGHEWFMARAFEEMARCHAMLGSAPAAWSRLDDAEALRRAWDPSTLIDTVEMRARVARLLGAFDVAAEKYRELIARLGEQRAFGPYREATAQAAVSITAGPTSYDAHAGLAVALHALGRDEEGTAQLEHARAALRRELGDQREQRVRVLARWASHHERCDVMTVAGELWREVADDADPRVAIEALASAAQCAWHRAEGEEAVTLLDRAVHEASSPELRAVALGHRARFAFFERDLDHGERLVSELDPPISVNVMYARACAHYSVDAQRGIELAGAVAETAAPWGPLLAAILAFYRGLTELGEKWEGRARAHLEREPDPKAASFLAATTAGRLRIAGRFSEAEGIVSEVEPPPGLPLYRAMRATGEAQLALARGDFDSALAILSSAVKEYPRSGDVRMRLALHSTMMEVRRAAGEDAVASEIAEATAIAARLPPEDPDLVPFLVEHAMECLRGRREDEALEAIERAGAVQRAWYGGGGIAWPAIELARACVLRAAGRDDDAVAALKRGVEAAQQLYGSNHRVHAELRELEAELEGSPAR